MNYQVLDAIQYGQLRWLKELLEKGANPDTRTREGNTLLSFAIITEQTFYHIFEFLINFPETKNQIFEKNKNGQTPLMLAINKDNIDYVRLLLNAGSDVNAVDNLGHSPLWYALSGGSPWLVKMLLEAGADVNSVDKPELIKSIWHLLKTEKIKDFILISLTPNDISRLDKNSKSKITENEILLAYMRLLSGFYNDNIPNRFLLKNGKIQFKGKEKDLPEFVIPLFQWESEYPGIIGEYLYQYHPELFKKQKRQRNIYQGILAPPFLYEDISNIIGEYTIEPENELERFELFADNYKYRKIQTGKFKQEVMRNIESGLPMTLRSAVPRKRPYRFVPSGYPERESELESPRLEDSDTKNDLRHTRRSRSRSRSPDRDLKRALDESLYEARKEYERRTGVASTSRVRGSKSSSSSSRKK